MFTLGEMNARQLDFFSELSNIGASHAVTALSTMVDRPINLHVPQVRFCAFDHICDILGGPENLVAGLLVEMSGDMSGFILLVQDADDARLLAEMLTRAMGLEDEPNGEFLTELQRSAIQEVANILSGSYITAISALTGLAIDCSVPMMVIDMAGAVMNLPEATYGQYGDIVLFLETAFEDQGRSLLGHFFLVPDAQSLQVLMLKMGLS